jgi:hypothetical protein
MKNIFIAWTRYDRRPTLLAEQLGGSTHFIHHGDRNKTPAFIRYLVQGWRTWQLLRQERPDVIFVQNPPIFAVLPAYLYCLFHPARYVIDSHTGAFIVAPWRSLLWLHRWLSRRAAATIVHNQDQEPFVQAWQVPYCVVGFPPGSYPAGQPPTLPAGLNVVYVCSFNGDEPVEAVFGAAELLPEVNFFITGDYGRLPEAQQARRPANCHFTGFMAYDDYIGLLRAVDLMLILTTRNHTLLMGGFEAVSLEKPMIVSDWPILRSYFPQGTVYTANTAVDIAAAIQQAEEQQPTLQNGIRHLRQQLEAEWETTSARLRQLIS